MMRYKEDHAEVPAQYRIEPTVPGITAGIRRLLERPLSTRPFELIYDEAESKNGTMAFTIVVQRQEMDRRARRGGTDIADAVTKALGEIQAIV